MRKVILFNMVSLDGFFEGTNKEIEKYNPNNECNEFGKEQLSTAYTLMFGKVTYELMSDYWPTPSGFPEETIIAEKMNVLPKIVFSKTLENTEMNNAKAIKENIAEEIIKLKEFRNGLDNDMIVFGSENHASAFNQLDFIDECRIMINPIAFGQDNPLLKRVNGKLDLNFLVANAFDSGNVLLYHEPKRN